VVQRTQTETIVYRPVASARTSGSSAERLCDVGGSAVGDVGLLGNGAAGLWSGCQDRHVPVLLKSC
jgi:hypothetical protein